jgi:UDP-2-acetamido-3-amino-2,3-dideoxy-glucuronate N-acetyltransferase
MNKKRIESLILSLALVVGNPAKQIDWACKCGERLPDDLECLVCNQKYEKNDN